MKNEADLLTLTPLENYEVPDFPTYADDKPNLEKKVPSRWKNKAIAATVMGLLGTATLAGCRASGNSQNEFPSVSFLNDREHCWMHHGGSGGAPLYVAYLTEQEAIGIIRTELESAGISFTDDAPSYSIEIDDAEDWGESRIHQVRTGLFNEEHNIAISIVESDAFHIPFFRFEMDDVAQLIENEFAKEYPHLSVGLFCSPDNWVGWWDDDVLTTEEKAEARQVLVDNLIAQAQEFAHQLREAGVID